MKPSNCVICVRPLPCPPDAHRRHLIKRHFHSELSTSTALQHRRICPTIDLLDGKHDVHYVVSVQYRTSLADEIRYCTTHNKRVSHGRLYRITKQLFLALNRLHNHSIHVGYLTPQALCLDDKGNLQLGDIGLYRLTALANQACSTPTIIRTQSPHIAPELVAAIESCCYSNLDDSKDTAPSASSTDHHGNNDDSEALSPYDLLVSRHGSACDVWSAGAILLEYAIGGKLILKDQASVSDFVDWCWEQLEAKEGKLQVVGGDELLHDSQYCEEVDESWDSEEYDDEFSDEYDEYDDDDDSYEYGSEYGDEEFDSSEYDDDYDDDGDDDEWDSYEEDPEEYITAWKRLEKVDLQWLRIVLHCLAWNPNNRPSVKQILQKWGHNVELESSADNARERDIAMADYVEWKEWNMSQGVNVTEFFSTRDGIRTIPSIFRYTRPLITLDNNSDDGGLLRKSSSSRYGSSDVTEGTLVDHHHIQIERMFCIPANVLREWCKTRRDQDNGFDSSMRSKRMSTSRIPTSEADGQPQERVLEKYDVLHSATGDLSGKRRQTLSFTQILTPLDRNMVMQKNLAIEYRRLLLDYPSTRSDIVRLAQRSGIPGVLRGEVWAAILGVEEDLVAQQLYDSIDTESPSSCDRQISVDVPRCHQYNLQLSTPEGHAKLTRVLKAWVKYHADENLVYWQGLDSLCAPFLVLNFHFEARAFCCLKGMVQRFVRGFFESDNSAAMEHVLALFEKLLLYHDPELAVHLHSIGYHPELYAIPWFLTLYAHVLPIEKLFRLWDRLLLSNDQRMSLYLGVAFLRQIRSTLLHSDFNTSVSLLTDMLTGINIHTAMEDMDRIADSTPHSLVNPTRDWLVKTEERSASKSHPEESGNLHGPRMTVLQYRERCLSGRITAEDFERTLINVAIVLDTRPEREFRRCHIAVADHVGLLDDEIRSYSRRRAQPKAVPDSVAVKLSDEASLAQQPSWLEATSSLVLSRLRTPSTPTTPINDRGFSSTNRQHHHEDSNTQNGNDTREEHEDSRGGTSAILKRIKERVLSLVTYKSGLPIVIISNREQQEQQLQHGDSGSHRTALSLASRGNDDNADSYGQATDGDMNHQYPINALTVVERLLARHSIPYVSVLHGGMEDIVKRTKIPVVQDDDDDDDDNEEN